jgi:hypothetical protein
MYTGAVSPSLGVMAENKLCDAIPRQAFALGQVGQFDLARSNANVTNALVGSPNSALANIIAPAAAGIAAGLLCVAQTALSNNIRGRCLLRGRTKALVIKAAGNIAAGDQLVANTSGYLSPDHSAGDRIVARALVAVTAPAAATLTEVDFDGVNGLATYVT